MEKRTAFALELTARMAASGVRPAAFVERSGMSRSTLAGYMSGARCPGVQAVKTICETLGWPLRDALEVAGYAIEIEPVSIDRETQEMASEIARMLEGLDGDERRVVRSQLRAVARSFVGLLAGKRNDNARLSARLGSRRLAVRESAFATA